MISPSQNRFHFFALFASLLGLSASTGRAQTFYTESKVYYVWKSQNFIQTEVAPASLAADSGSPFRFAVRTPTNTAMGLPDGSTVAVPLLSGTANFGISRDFPTKTALDAAFPNGTYRLTGATIPSLSFSLATDAYPAVIPAVANTTWTRGILVLDSRQTNVIRINPFTGYASNGLIGYVQIRLQDLPNNLVVLDEVVSATNLVGVAPQATPITMLIIGAGSLRSSRIYRGQVTFANVTTFDQNALPQAAAVATFSRTTTFYVAMTTGGVAPAETLVTTQPTSQSGVAGGTVTFSLAVNPPLAFGEFLQWNFNGQPITLDNNKFSSSDGQSLTVSNLSAADVGSYSATIVSAGGIVTSNTATLTLVAASSPAISRQPSSLTINAGATAVFSVAASGAPNPSYQWQRNGANIQGATSAALVLVGSVGTNAAIAGNYSVVVSNSAGTVTSDVATLAPAANVNDPGRLINLSILTPLAAGEKMTMGTVLGGTNTSGNKPLLVRAAGPALGQFGITTFLPDPSMTLNFTTPTPAVVVATNNDWAGDTALSAVFTAVGAFPYAATTSKDAAIARTGTSALAPGNYTVEVTDATAGSGTVIAEIYDATPAANFFGNTPRLVNVSVLKTVSAGASLTVGFVIGGSSARTVLIRAIGPGLTPLGVGGAMADPQLTLVNTATSATVGANNDWGGDLGISQTATRVGAFAITNTTSKDAMLLVTLAPGQYTAQVSPVSGTAGGTAIVEVYEVP